MKKCLAVILVLCACIASFTGCSKREVVNVYNWGVYIGPDVVEQFEKETGIKVNYSTFDSNEIMYAKMLGSKGNYDVIFPSDYMIERLIKQDMLMELDYSQLPNTDLLDETYLNMPYDPENAYSVPYMWGTVGIVYNKEMVSEPITSWDVLWDEQYAKKIIMYDSSRDSFAVAFLHDGLSLNSRDDESIATAEAALKAQKPLLLCYGLDDCVDKMLAGEAAMSVVYSGQAMMILADEEKGDQFEYVVPEEGSNIWVDCMAIPKDAPNKEAALKFIDFMCRTDIALANVEEIQYSTPHKEAYKLLDEEMQNNPAAYPAQDVIGRCTSYTDMGEYLEKFEDAWTRVKAG